MIYKLIIIFFLSLLSLYANPWGKDSDLCNKHEKSLPTVKNCSTPILGKFAEVMIGFHQNIISPADGPRSHFYPSSSQYTLDAMRKYGFFTGVYMGCDRLMRENNEEWVYRKIVDPQERLMKWDPIR